MLFWIASLLLLTLAGAGALFSAAAALLVGRYRAMPVAGDMPAVTVLKPLHGAEPALGANLATLFAQAYPAPVQVIAGVRNADDPARAVLADAARHAPHVALDSIADATRHGTNNKLSNLINMATHIRHPLVVMADSDVAWPPDTLRQLAAALADPTVGLASCLHAGRGDAGFWSTVAAMDISYRYMPSVIVGTALGLAKPALGPTMALRRETLDAIGGFAAFSDVLADDYEIGRAVRGLGLKTMLPRCFVVHGCSESSLAALVAHELRWSVTIFRIDPGGYAGSVMVHALPLALLGAAAAGFSAASLWVLAGTLLARAAVKIRMDMVSGVVSGPLMLMPFRDVLSFGIFWATFFVHDVDWRGTKFRVTRDGKLH